MQSPQCQFENREGANFCKKCGDRLELKCPSCGCLYQSENIYCDGCGHALKKSSGTPPGSDSKPIFPLDEKVASTPPNLKGNENMSPSFSPTCQDIPRCLKDWILRK